MAGAKECSSQARNSGAAAARLTDRVDFKEAAQARFDGKFKTFLARARAALAAG